VITTLNDLGTIKLDFSVPATYLATLRPGLAIQARASAPRGRLFAGQVSYVNTEVDPVTRSVLVRALLPNPDGLLRPGMLMTVTLYKDERDALVVPEAALVSRGREATVLAVSAGEPARVERRPVRIGTRSPGIVEVLEGLAEGERVITHGTLRVRPGQAVVVRAVERPGEGLDELLREPRAAAGGG
jgi:membrane fusion protein (multidrug efflux system)